MKFAAHLGVGMLRNAGRCASAGLLLMLALNPIANAQSGDGPRAFQLLPADSQVVSAWGLFSRGNQTPDAGTVLRGTQVKTDVGVLMYIRTLELAGQQTALFATLPFGRVSADFDLTRQTVERSSSGTADFQLGGVFGLVGSPNLAAQNYGQFKPGFALGALAMLSLPTGSYDRNQALNMGAKRWNLRLGLPITHYIGRSLVDDRLTTIELQPSLTIFGTNDEPYNAQSRKQAPLFKLESHIAQNFAAGQWVSIDALYSHGGETTTDGIKGDDSQRALSMGLSLNIPLSRSIAIKTSYGGVVWRNDSGPDGYAVRIITSMAF